MLVWRAPERKWHAFVNKCFFGERRRLKSLCRSHCINEAGYPCKCTLNETHNVKKKKKNPVLFRICLILQRDRTENYFSATETAIPVLLRLGISSGL